MWKCVTPKVTISDYRLSHIQNNCKSCGNVSLIMSLSELFTPPKCDTD